MVGGVEGYREGAGWALPEKRTYQNQGYQDQLDAATIYNLLENDIIPMAVIVNKANTADELSADQVKSIYVGDVTTWDEVSK